MAASQCSDVILCSHTPQCSHSCLLTLAASENTSISEKSGSAYYFKLSEYAISDHGNKDNANRFTDCDEKYTSIIPDINKQSRTPTLGTASDDNYLTPVDNYVTPVDIYLTPVDNYVTPVDNYLSPVKEQHRETGDDEDYSQPFDDVYCVDPLTHDDAVDDTNHNHESSAEVSRDKNLQQRDYQAELQVSLSSNALYDQRQISIYNEIDEIQVYNDLDDETQAYYNDVINCASSASAVQHADHCAQQPKHNKLKLFPRVALLSAALIIILVAIAIIVIIVLLHTFGLSLRDMPSVHIILTVLHALMPLIACW